MKLLPKHPRSFTLQSNEELEIRKKMLKYMYGFLLVFPSTPFSFTFLLSLSFLSFTKFQTCFQAFTDCYRLHFRLVGKAPENDKRD